MKRWRRDPAVQVMMPGEMGSLAGNVSVKYSSRRRSSCACAVCSEQSGNGAPRRVPEARAAARKMRSTGWFMASVRDGVDEDQYWSTPLCGQRRRTVQHCQTHDVFCRDGGYRGPIGMIGFFAIKAVVPSADSRSRKAQSPSVLSDRFWNDLRMSARPPERRLSRLTTAASLR